MALHFVDIFICSKYQLLTSPAVHRWGPEIQEGIYDMVQLLVDLVAIRLQHEPIPLDLLHLLAMVSANWMIFLLVHISWVHIVYIIWFFAYRVYYLFGLWDRVQSCPHLILHILPFFLGSSAAMVHFRPSVHFKTMGPDLFIPFLLYCPIFLNSSTSSSPHIALSAWTARHFNLLCIPGLPDLSGLPQTDDSTGLNN